MDRKEKQGGWEVERERERGKKSKKEREKEGLCPEELS